MMAPGVRPENVWKKPFGHHRLFENWRLAQTGEAVEELLEDLLITREEAIEAILDGH